MPNKIHHHHRQKSKPARACDACFDIVFPVIHSSSNRGVATYINNKSHKPNSHLPSWLSIPSLPVARQPHVLMRIDTTSSSGSHPISSFDDDNKRQRKG